MVFQEGVCFLEYHILFVTIYGPGAVNQCQLVKRFEKQINGLNIGIKSYLEVNLETNGVYHAI